MAKIQLETEYYAVKYTTHDAYRRFQAKELIVVLSYGNTGGQFLVHAFAAHLGSLEKEEIS
jgi:hypothetical protein